MPPPYHLSQITNPRLSNVVSSLSPAQFFNRLVPNFINIGLIVGVLVFVFILILGGINWITSTGDRGKVEEARSRITQALTGLAILFFLFALIQFLNLGLGVNIGNLGLPHIGDPAPPPPVISTATPIPTLSPTPEVEPPPVVTSNCFDDGGSCSCDCPAEYYENSACLSTPPDCPLSSCTCVLDSLFCSYDINTADWETNYDGTYRNLVIGQSFTPTETGSLSHIDYCGIEHPEWLIEIREGENINGATLATANSINDTHVDCAIHPWVHWIRITFDTPLELNAGHRYTLIAGDTSGNEINMYYRNPEVYPYQPGTYSGGMAYVGYWDTDSDFFIRVNLCTPSTCAERCSPVLMWNCSADNTCGGNPDYYPVGSASDCTSSTPICCCRAGGGPTCSNPGGSCLTDSDCCQLEGLSCGCSSSTCVCTAPPPLPSGCNSHSDCGSGEYCVVSADNDGDGYLLEAQAAGATGHCQSSPADCNDNNADVHPDQFEYFEDPIPGTTDDFNYDCADADGDGDLNDKWPTLNCQTTLNTTSCQNSQFPDSMSTEVGYVASIPDCGTSISLPFRDCASYYHTDCSGNSAHYFGCLHLGFCFTLFTPPTFQAWRITDYTPLPDNFPGNPAYMPCK